MSFSDIKDTDFVPIVCVFITVGFCFIGALLRIVYNSFNKRFDKHEEGFEKFLQKIEPKLERVTVIDNEMENIKDDIKNKHHEYTLIHKDHEFRIKAVEFKTN